MHPFTKKFIIAIATFVIAISSLSAFAQSPREGADRLEQFLSEFPDLGPGYAVVAVTADDVLLNQVWGQRRSSTADPLLAETPMYIASQTKAYVGLLAARLDELGILSLESTLADHWPAAQFPESFDPSVWTMSDLLSHQVPLEADIIVFLEAYVTQINAHDYPALLETSFQTRQPGFQYDNLGYNIYAAILETKTGKPWQDWLDEIVLAPLGLEQTSARTSDFGNANISWSHIWSGAEEGWIEIRPKTDKQMQSAGGMVTSPNDMIAWLQANLRQSGSNHSGLTSESFERAHMLTSVVERSRRNVIELPCYGYSLGWNICDFEGHTLYVHGGTYTGSRSIMAFSPDLGVGIAVFSNSDNMTGWLTSRTAIQFLQFVTDHVDADRWAAARQEQYPQRILRLLDGRRARLVSARENPKFGEWDWQPATHELAQFAGTYENPDLYSGLIVQAVETKLMVSWGDYSFTAQPATPDIFAASTQALDPPKVLEFERDDDGKLISVSYGGFEFMRK